MRTIWILLAVFWVGAVVSAQGPVVEEVAFVEVESARETYFRFEPIRVRVRFGFEARFLQDHLIQMFRQELDVPAQVAIPWLEAPEGATIFVDPDEESAPEARVRIALNDDVVQVRPLTDLVRDGRTFRAFEIERSYLPSEVGLLVVPAPELRFAYGTQFREDFISGRVAIDRKDEYVRGEDLALRIQPIPEAGRPEAFGGAVGRFTMQTEAVGAEEELEVGQSFKLELRIEGRGNLAFFEPPDLGGSADFHVFGRIEESDDRGRTVVYDLAARHENVRAVPALELVFFDPGPPGEFRAVRTTPISLSVRARPGGERLEGPPEDVTPSEEPEAQVVDIFGLKPMRGSAASSVSSRVSIAVILLVLALPWLLALWVRSWMRARDRDRRDPAGARARRAARSYLRARRRGVAPGPAFTEYVAARSRVAAAAVIRPDLDARLEETGMSTALAQRSAIFVEELTASRYGGADVTDGDEEIGRLVEELESFFRDQEASP